MAKKWNFVWLASSLTLEERQELLRKINSHSKLSMEPLYFDDDFKTASIPNTESDFTRIPWFYRIWLNVLSLIRNTAPKKLFLQKEVSALGGKIEKKFPNLYDSKNALLLPVFYQSILKLKDAAHFFSTALDAGLSRERESFYAFLGSLEMPNIHRRLQIELSPASMENIYPNAQETELRKISLKVMDDILGMITKEQRNAMYTNARSLFNLLQLASFPFDKLFSAYNTVDVKKRYTCPAENIKDSIISLSSVLASLKTVPQMSLMESLFIFLLQKKAKDPGFNIDKEINFLLLKTEESLNIIRNFNRSVPLAYIIRCSSKELTFTPRELSGGEDWFVLYKEYWRKQIDNLFGEYYRERRQQSLLNSFDSFLMGGEVKYIENTRSKNDPHGIPVKGAFAISFLQTFCINLLGHNISQILYLVFIGAEFRRDEDRIIFAEAYNRLINLEEEIKNFEHKVSKSGEFGRQYSQANNDVVVVSLVKQRRLQAIIGKIQEEAGKIIDQARTAAVNMVSILDGILGDGSPGRNSYLYNFSRLVARDSKFVTDTREAVEKLQTMLVLLSEIETMEHAR